MMQDEMALKEKLYENPEIVAQAVMMQDGMEGRVFGVPD